MKNILIVESENDEYFIEALARKVSSENEVRKIYEYKHSSLDPKRLTNSLTCALTDVRSRGVSKIGIILDMDDSTKEERIKFINDCLINSFSECGYPYPSNFLADTNQFIRNPVDDEMDVDISCFFTNVDGEGELETLLKAIKSKNSVFADCLYDGWKDCLIKNNKTVGRKGKPCDISDKELLKLWVDFYKRFDTLKRGDRNEKNTDWKGIMLGITKSEQKLNKARGEEIFDLNSDKLDDIKCFLNMFD